jgi:FKBP-type peptidyl-prolyl cis-trans isomerase
LWELSDLFRSSDFNLWQEISSMRSTVAALGAALMILALGSCKQSSSSSGGAAGASATTTTGGSSAATTSGSSMSAGGASAGGASATAPAAGAASTAGAAAAVPGAATNGAQQVTTPSGLKYTDLKVGDGTVAENGMVASVHYTGWLNDGTKFDSSLDRGTPFSFKIGSGQVIRGWDEGVKGMRVGGKRKLVIPPDLGYGDRGAGGVIPPNAWLVFDVELVELHP